MAALWGPESVSHIESVVRGVIVRRMGVLAQSGKLDEISPIASGLELIEMSHGWERRKCGQE